MKKCVAMLLALLLCAAPALAEGVLTVDQENFYVVPVGSTWYGYLYVKLENTGDAPLKVDGGELNILDANGEVLATSTTLWRYAEYLQPGEYTYCYMYKTIDGIESEDQVGGYDVNYTTRESKYTSLRFPSETLYEPDYSEGSWTHDYITTTVTNDMDQTVFDMEVVRALLDDKGNILFIDSDSNYVSKGITPGSSYVVRTYVSSNFMKMFEEKGIVGATVESIAYADVEDASLYTRGGAGTGNDQGEGAQEAASAAVEQPATVQTEYATLQKGSKGEDVRALQQRLKDLGYLTGSVDGDFGKGTEKAVSAFQGKAGLPANGIADDATQKALFADDAPRA